MINESYKKLISGFGEDQLISEYQSLKRITAEHAERKEKLPPHIEDYRLFVAERIVCVLGKVVN